MSSKFWACFTCGVHFRGTDHQIAYYSTHHMCEHNGAEVENVKKVAKGIRQILSGLLPPPPPSIKNVDIIGNKYKNDEIYMFIGTVLLAINPNKNIEELYSDSTMKTYYQHENPTPHVYSIANEALKNIKTGPSQSIIISGESGSGKTETCKHIIKYLSGTAEKDLMVSLNHAGTLLDAFGNAATGNNTNSSRYCKFVEIHYNEDVEVMGGKIRHFMLEKGRILQYHIFGSLLTASPDIKSFLKLNDPLFEDIERQVPVSMSLDELDKAFNQLLPSKKYDLYQFVGGIFALSQISFRVVDDKCLISEVRPVELAAMLLGIDSDELKIALTCRTITVPDGETISTPLNISQSKRARDALVKTIYINLHQYVVDQINNKIASRNLDDTLEKYIGILDMPGFECFPVNTFEQLMINYTNEVMQNFCLKSVMKDEEVLKTFHHDDVIDLMENPKMGILTLLDDEVKLQATANFAEIVYKNCSSSPVLIKQNIMSTLFTVQHYAAKVTYQTENFVETNTGATSETVLKLAEVSLRNITNTEVSLPRIRFSEGLKLKHQLQQLIATLEVNGAHFIRCVKPNDQQKCDHFDEKLVEQQLLCTGTNTLINNEQILWKFGEKADEEDDDENGKPIAEHPAKIAKKSEEPSVSTPIPNRKRNQKMAENPLRFDRCDHWVMHDGYQSGSRCKYMKCNKTIHTFCSKCKVYLCCIRDRNCFMEYHTQT